MQTVMQRMRRGVALVTCVFFLQTSLFSSSPAQAAPIEPATFSVLPLRFDALQIPGEIGKVDDTFTGTSNFKVIVVQDAHAIPDAQRSIRKAILYFHQKYGVNLVALEGASAKLDARMLKSFPDKDRLNKVLGEYFDQGELAGGTAAAISGIKAEDNSAAGSRMIFQGVEDWPVYEEALGLYLAAMGKEKEVLRELEVRSLKLEEEKQEQYSKELQKIDAAIKAFRENRSDFMKTLEALAAVKTPAEGSELALLLEQVKKETKGHEDQDNSAEVKALAAQVARHFLTAAATSETKSLQNKFQGKKQEFQTSQITPEAFALSLKTIAFKAGLQIQVSDQLLGLVKKEKRMTDIEGTKLFADFERFAQSIKESLFKNDADRELDRRDRRLWLASKLAKLEVSYEDWVELEQMRSEGTWSVDGLKMNSMETLFEPHFEFYQNAQKRDEVFFKNLTAQLKNIKAAGNSAVMVAGGFHAHGLCSLLKENGISYALVMPEIKNMPVESHYRAHMRGDVSWKNYFEVTGGKVNLYNAFIRGTRDRLLGTSRESSVVSLEKKQNPRPIPQDPRLLKNWRDQIIRDLADEGRIEKAGEYTRFIDELTGEGRDQAIQKRLAQVDKFLQDLKKLDAQGQFTAPNIAKLFQPATVGAGPTSGGVLSAKSEMRAFAAGLAPLPEELPRPAAKSEVLSQEVKREDRSSGISLRNEVLPRNAAAVEPFNAYELLAEPIRALRVQMNDPQSEVGQVLERSRQDRQTYTAYLHGLEQKVRQDLFGAVDADTHPVDSVYYPFGGFDPYVPFTFFSEAQDIYSMGFEGFGAVADIKRFLESKDNAYLQSGGRYSAYDSARDIYSSSSAPGALAIARIMGHLGADIQALHYFELTEDGAIRYLRENEVRSLPITREYLVQSLGITDQESQELFERLKGSRPGSYDNYIDDQGFATLQFERALLPRNVFYGTPDNFEKKYGYDFQEKLMAALRKSLNKDKSSNVVIKFKDPRTGKEKRYWYLQNSVYSGILAQKNIEQSFTGVWKQILNAGFIDEGGVVQPKIKKGAAALNELGLNDWETGRLFEMMSREYQNRKAYQSFVSGLRFQAMLIKGANDMWTADRAVGDFNPAAATELVFQQTAAQAVRNGAFTVSDSRLEGQFKVQDGGPEFHSIWKEEPRKITLESNFGYNSAGENLWFGQADMLKATILTAKSEVRVAATVFKTVEELKSLIRNTDDAFRFLHRTKQTAAEQILKEGLYVAPSSGRRLESTASPSTPDGEQALLDFNKPHRGSDSVVILSFPAALLKEAKLRGVDMLLQQTTQGGLTMPTEFIQGYAKQNPTQSGMYEYTPNPSFEKDVAKLLDRFKYVPLQNDPALIKAGIEIFQAQPRQQLSDRIQMVTNASGVLSSIQFDDETLISITPSRRFGSNYEVVQPHIFLGISIDKEEVLIREKDGSVYSIKKDGSITQIDLQGSQWAAVPATIAAKSEVRPSDGKSQVLIPSEEAQAFLSALESGQQRLRGTWTEESEKRFKILGNIGADAEKLVRGVLGNDDVNIAIVPLGSTLKGYSGADSDVEYQIYITGGFPQEVSETQKAEIYQGINELLEKKSKASPETEKIKVEPLVGSSTVWGEGILNVSLDLARDEVLDAHIRHLYYLFLPHAYDSQGDREREARRLSFLEMLVRKNRGWVWGGIQSEYSSALSVEFFRIDSKEHLQAWLKAQGVSDISNKVEIEGFNKGRSYLLGLPARPKKIFDVNPAPAAPKASETAKSEVRSKEGAGEKPAISKDELLFIKSALVTAAKSPVVRSLAKRLVMSKTSNITPGDSASRNFQEGRQVFKLESADQGGASVYVMTQLGSQQTVPNKNPALISVAEAVFVHDGKEYLAQIFVKAAKTDEALALLAGEETGYRVHLRSDQSDKDAIANSLGAGYQQEGGIISERDGYETVVSQRLLENQEVLSLYDGRGKGVDPVSAGLTTIVAKIQESRGIELGKPFAVAMTYRLGTRPTAESVIQESSAIGEEVIGIALAINGTPGKWFRVPTDFYNFLVPKSVFLRIQPALEQDPALLLRAIEARLPKMKDLLFQSFGPGGLEALPIPAIVGWDSKSEKVTMTNLNSLDSNDRDQMAAMQGFEAASAKSEMREPSGIRTTEQDQTAVAAGLSIGIHDRMLQIQQNYAVLEEIAEMVGGMEEAEHETAQAFLSDMERLLSPNVRIEDLKKVLLEHDAPSTEQGNVRESVSRQTGFPADQIIFLNSDDVFGWSLKDETFASYATEPQNLEFDLEGMAGVHLLFHDSQGQAMTFLLIRNDSKVMLQSAKTMLHEIAHTRQSPAALTLYRRKLMSFLIEGFQAHNEIAGLRLLAQDEKVGAQIKTWVNAFAKMDFLATVMNEGGSVDPFEQAVGRTVGYKSETSLVNELLQVFGEKGRTAIEAIFYQGDVSELRGLMGEERFNALEQIFEIWNHFKAADSNALSRYRQSLARYVLFDNPSAVWTAAQGQRFQLYVQQLAAFLENINTRYRTNFLSMLKGKEGFDGFLRQEIGPERYRKSFDRVQVLAKRFVQNPDMTEEESLQSLQKIFKSQAAPEAKSEVRNTDNDNTPFFSTLDSALTALETAPILTFKEFLTEHRKSPHYFRGLSDDGLANAFKTGALKTNDGGIGLFLKSILGAADFANDGYPWPNPNHRGMIVEASNEIIEEKKLHIPGYEMMGPGAVKIKKTPLEMSQAHRIWLYQAFPNREEGGGIKVRLLAFRYPQKIEAAAKSEMRSRKPPPLLDPNGLVPNSMNIQQFISSVKPPPLPLSIRGAGFLSKLVSLIFSATLAGPLSGAPSQKRTIKIRPKSGAKSEVRRVKMVRLGSKERKIHQAQMVRFGDVTYRVELVYSSDKKIAWQLQPRDAGNAPILLDHSGEFIVGRPWKGQDDQRIRKPDIVIVSPKNGVSNHHAVLTITKTGALFVRDLESTNGTFVERLGEIVSSARLKAALNQARRGGDKRFKGLRVSKVISKLEELKAGGAENTVFDKSAEGQFLSNVLRPQDFGYLDSELQEYIQAAKALYEKTRNIKILAQQLRSNEETEGYSAEDLSNLVDWTFASETDWPEGYQDLIGQAKTAIQSALAELYPQGNSDISALESYVRVLKQEFQQSDLKAALDKELAGESLRDTSIHAPGDTALKITEAQPVEGEIARSENRVKGAYVPGTQSGTGEDRSTKSEVRQPSKVAKKAAEQFESFVLNGKPSLRQVWNKIGAELIRWSTDTIQRRTRADVLSMIENELNTLINATGVQNSVDAVVAKQLMQAFRQKLIPDQESSDGIALAFQILSERDLSRLADVAREVAAQFKTDEVTFLLQAADREFRQKGMGIIGRYSHGVKVVPMTKMSDIRNPMIYFGPNQKDLIVITDNLDLPVSQNLDLVGASHDAENASAIVTPDDLIQAQVVESFLLFIAAVELSDGKTTATHLNKNLADTIRKIGHGAALIDQLPDVYQVNKQGRVVVSDNAVLSMLIKLTKAMAASSEVRRAA